MILGKVTELWNNGVTNCLFMAKKNRGRGAVKCQVFELNYVSHSNMQLLHTLGLKYYSLAISLARNAGWLEFLPHFIMLTIGLVKIFIIRPSVNV